MPLRRIGAGIKVDPGEIGRFQLLQHQRNCASQYSGSERSPDVDSGRMFPRLGHLIEIGMAGVERVGRQLKKGRFLERQQRNKALADWRGRIILLLACYCPYSVVVVSPN